MSYTSNYNLNIRLSNLESKINGGGIPTSATLADVLLNGDSAGASDLDMNNNDILNVANINGSPYPPTAPTFDEVLTAGNSSSNTFILTNSGNANGQSGSQIVLDGAGSFGTASNTINKTSSTILDTDGLGQTAINTITTGGMNFSLDDNNTTGTAGGQIVANIGGSNVANMSLSAGGIATPPFPAPTGLSILQELLSIVGDSTLNERGIFKLVFSPGTAEA
jgi:hypothetical protein